MQQAETSTCYASQLLTLTFPLTPSVNNRRLYTIGKRQAVSYGLYVVSGTSARYASQLLALLAGGALVYQGAMTPEQLATFMFYVEMVNSSSLSVCDQYGSIMEVGVALWSSEVAAVLG